MRFSFLAAVRVAFAGLVMISAGFAQGTWTFEAAPSPRDNHAMAYDSLRGRTVLFGGQLSGPIPPLLIGDTWEWDGSRWHAMTPAATPPARTGHAMVYDNTRNRVVLFGGAMAGFGAQLFNDTWEWDGVNWTQLNPATSPPALTEHAMTFDLIRGVVVLQGGRDSMGKVQDTWEWNGTTWTQVALLNPAPMVAQHELVYDVFRSRTILFGGDNASGISAETWEYDGAAWSQVGTTNAPGARIEFAMVLDVFRQRTVVFGGQGGGFGVLDDIWTYDGATATWTQQVPAQSPPGRYGTAGVLDQSTQRMLVFGGQSSGGLGGIPRSDLWAWNGTGWTDVRSEPRSRFGHAVADAPSVGGVLLFGGDDGRGNILDDTWRWNGERWQLLAPATTPGPRRLPAMAYDPARDRVVLFGGFDGASTVGETWEWDGANWLQRPTATAPPARQAHAMAWDPVGQRVLLFGGIAPGVANDTWAWDGTSWTQLAPTTVPPARARHMMASAPDRGRVVMFGGVGTTFRNDTWEWDGSNWISAPPGPAPAGRRGAAFAHDPRRGQTVLHGGANSSRRFDDTWEWDGNAWVANPRTGPSKREGHSMAFDSKHGELVAFGGEDAPRAFSETWTFGSAADADASEFGAGCAGTMGAPELAPDPWSLPWVGGNFTVRASNVPAPIGVLMYTGFSDTSWGGNPLPLDLSFLGMTGCSLLVSADVPFPFTPAPPNEATWTLPIPNVASLAGIEFFNQAIVLDIPANSLGLTVTNGLASRIGIR